MDVDLSRAREMREERGGWVLKSIQKRGRIEDREKYGIEHELDKI